VREAFNLAPGGIAEMSAIIMRYGTGLFWLGFFAFVLAAWLALYQMQPGELAFQGFGRELLLSLCAPLTGSAGFGGLFLMWALMSAAMMAPTFVPTLRTYFNLTHTEAASGLMAFGLVAGYGAVWLVFSLLAAAAQLSLARAALVDGLGQSQSLWLTAGLLAVAGGYQFSTLKEACLNQCRAPLMFFMGHWKPGGIGAIQMGLRLGAVCLGCCWALMALGFVGGVMNLVWMGIATLLMALEKLPQIGRIVTRPLGIVLLAGAVFSALAAMEYS